MAGGNEVGLTDVNTTYGVSLKNRVLGQKYSSRNSVTLAAGQWVEFWMQNANIDGSNNYDTTFLAIQVTSPRMSPR